MHQGDGFMAALEMGEDAWSSLLGDPADETWALHLTSKKLTCGGAVDDGGKVCASHDLQQQIDRERPC